jgi:hypothetical protein
LCWGQVLNTFFFITNKISDTIFPQSSWSKLYLRQE